MSEIPLEVSEPVPVELVEQMKQQASEFRVNLTSLLNTYSCENGSDTPDFVLAGYILRCLNNFDLTTIEREKWNGRRVGGISIPPQGWPLP